MSSSRARERVGMVPSTMGRREALRRIGGAALAAPSIWTLSGCAGDSASITLGPWPALPSARSMAIWCEGYALPDATLVDLDGHPIATAVFEPLVDGIHLARLEGLTPDTEYRFRVGDEVGSFRTMPESNGLVRIAIGADIHVESAPHVCFDRIRELAPHLWLGLGDHVYADLGPESPTAPTLQAYVDLYRRTWDDASLRECWANVPTLLVWDDHETWNDFDGTSDVVRAEAARAAYERFQRSRSPSDRAWTVLDAGPVSLFVLDTRSFRSPNLAPDGPDKTMLGVEQRDALFAWLAATRTRPARVIASPTPFHAYADTGADAWAHGFAFERDLVLAAIAANDPENVILVSADQHWPGVFELALPGGGALLELMCTPTAAFTRPPPYSFGPDALFIGDGRGFGWLEVEGSTSPATISFAWIDDTGAERFSLVRP